VFDKKKIKIFYKSLVRNQIMEGPWTASECDASASLTPYGAATSILNGAKLYILTIEIQAW